MLFHMVEKLTTNSMDTAMNKIFDERGHGIIIIYAKYTLVKNTVKMQSIVFSAVSMLFVVSFSAM